MIKYFTFIVNYWKDLNCVTALLLYILFFETFVHFVRQSRIIKSLRLLFTTIVNIIVLFTKRHKRKLFVTMNSQKSMRIDVMLEK